MDGNGTREIIGSRVLRLEKRVKGLFLLGEGFGGGSDMEGSKSEGQVADNG